MPLARKIFKTHFNNQATAMEETMRNRKKTKMEGEGVIDPRTMMSSIDQQEELCVLKQRLTQMGLGAALSWLVFKPTHLYI